MDRSYCLDPYTLSDCDSSDKVKADRAERKNSNDGPFYKCDVPPKEKKLVLHL